MHRNSTNQIQHHTVGSAPNAPGANRFSFAREDGQALVELAFVLPFLLLLVFMIARGALALNFVNDDTHLANEVARYAAVNENPGCTSTPCSTGLAAWGKGQAESDALKSKGKVCIKFLENPTTKTTGQIGDPVEVVLEQRIELLPVIEVEEAVTRKAVMRLEAAPTTYGIECA
jgi:hypothetical protein